MTINMRTRALTALGILSTALAATAQAQARTDTLYLDELQHTAERVDRRSGQLDLLVKQSALRLESIRSERLPAINGTGLAQYLSAVASVGAVLPNAKIPSPYNDQYDASVTVRTPLIDPTRAGRVVVERAQAEESAARVRTALYQQRALVSDAFFGVLLRDAQVRSLDATVADLDGRMTVAATRVAAGAALPSEQLLLQAERVRRVQSREELVVERDAAREVLSALIGREVPARAALVVRVPSAAVAYAPALADTVRARPEFAQFERTRAVLEARRSVTSAQDLPRVSVFARSGYGRPGLNALARNFDTYWTSGVQVDWSLWNWGRTRRDVEVQALQDEATRSDERAFREGLTRASVTERARLRNLEQSLVTDDTIVALRERILRETRLRFDEGDVSAADFIARLTEHLSAQLDRDTHRVRLDESRARYLTTLGLEVR